MLKEETKIFKRKLNTKNINARESLSMVEVEPYWKSLWGEEVELNEGAEWIRKEERRKLSNMDVVPIQIMKITSILSKAHN
jgi:hypothetical protein